MIARLLWLDAARGLAVVAMVAFHVIWDLAHFGYIEQSIPWSAPVRAFGHGIAFSFLFVAGFSLALAHRDNIRWSAFWRRFGLIAGAAALVSAGTYVVFPDAWVFFGILHVIAAASLAAVPFLRAPWLLTLGAGAFALIAPWLIAAPALNNDWLLWLGLGEREPMTQDWRPFFPWAGALLLGVAAGQMHPPLSWGRAFRETHWERGLALLGRHSLIIYLVHQPALFALFTAFAHFAPAGNDNPEFVAACEAGCIERGTARPTCHTACACLSNEVTHNNALAGVADNAERDARLEKFARRCLEDSISSDGERLH